MKAQTEVLGFAMVVLLVSVGMLFIVSFVVLNSGNDVKRTFTDKQLAVNMNDALLSSTSGCKRLTYEDLIKNCAEANDVICSSAPLVRACNYLEMSLDNIFDQTLRTWQKDYSYRIYYDGEVCEVGDPRECLVGPLTYGPSNCEGELEPGIFYLPVNGRTLFVRLDICE